MLRLIKYNFKRMIKSRSQMFWSILFPIAMITIFQLVIGNAGDLIGEMEAIPVAVFVENEELHEAEIQPSQQAFVEMIGMIGMEEGEENEDAIIALHRLSREEADVYLAEGDIVGIIELNGEDISLYVANEGIRQTILVTMTNRFYQIHHTLGTIAEYDPMLLQQAVLDLSSELNVNQTVETGRGNIAPMFFIQLAFVAYVCLMGSHFGLMHIIENQANRSPLGARQSLSPTKKSKQIIAGIVAGSIVQTLFTSVVILYLSVVLGAGFGNRLPLIFVTALVGSLIGVCIGVFYAAVMRKGNAKSQDSILSGIMLGLSVLSGMMMIDIRLLVRERFMILDRLNPMTRLVDAFYALGSFEDYRIFSSNMLTLLGMAVIFSVVGVLMLRRNSYDSI